MQYTGREENSSLYDLFFKPIGGDSLSQSPFIDTITKIKPYDILKPKEDSPYNVRKVIETDGTDTYIVEVKALGLSGDDISVKMKGGKLYIKSDPITINRDDVSYIQKEFYTDNLDMEIDLQDMIDVNKIKCSCSSGILTIMLPIQKEKERVIKVL